MEMSKNNTDVELNISEQELIDQIIKLSNKDDKCTFHFGKGIKLNEDQQSYVTSIMNKYHKGKKWHFCCNNNGVMLDSVRHC